MTGNNDDSGLDGMLVDAVITACPLIDPSVVFDHTNRVAYFRASFLRAMRV
jgi:hypothetical protein